MNFSVLMAIYYKESPKNFTDCLDSLVKQSLIPSEIVIIKDGPLTQELDSIIDQFSNNYNNLFKVIALEENVGLGKALAIGVKNCTYELIARMDTDDICSLNRFEKQIQEFESNPNLCILGSNIIEFDNTIDNILSKRLVPLSHDEIYKYAKKRNPFNHMTVMYKKSKVIEAGNYMPPNGFEDYYLWIRMLMNNCETKNLNDFLVYARTGNDMFERRGGYDYLKKSIKAKYIFYKIGFYSLKNFIVSLGSHLIVSILPNKIRSYIYIKFLRKEAN